LNGNTGTTNGNFLGTTDTQPLELRVNNSRVLLLATGDTFVGAAPILVGGHPSNSVAPGAGGSTIAGGGSASFPNTIRAPYGFIGAGVGNLVTGDQFSAVVGGTINDASRLNSFIGAGEQNLIAGSGDNAAIAAGMWNRGFGYISFIGGGFSNYVGSDYSGLVAGRDNIIADLATYAFIGGGQSNAIAASSTHSVIGGGRHNKMDNDSKAAVIAGGEANVLRQGNNNSAIGGGYGNIVDQYSILATIAGGSVNTVGTNAPAATIGGGEINSIAHNGYAATIGGGSDNSVADAATYATVGGGYNNNAGGIAATVPGGQNNDAANTLTFAAGNRAKAVQPGVFVWADSTDADFSSSGNDQFLIRASGGIFQGNQDTNLWRVTGLKVVTNANTRLYYPIHVGAQLLDIGSNRIYYAVGLTTNDWKGANLN
jgi:hypothetical protein